MPNAKIIILEDYLNVNVLRDTLNKIHIIVFHASISAAHASKVKAENNCIKNNVSI